MSDLPPNWVLSTELKHNYTYHNPDEEKTLVILKNDSNGWQCKGLVGFGNTDDSYPVFESDTTLEKAKATAIDIIKRDVNDIDTEHSDNEQQKEDGKKRSDSDDDSPTSDTQKETDKKADRDTDSQTQTSLDTFE